MRNRILILDRAGHDSKSGSHLGFKEREAHITLQANGYILYGVVCEHSGAQGKDAALIKSFDPDQLLVLGKLHETRQGKFYADIDRTISTDELTIPRDLTLQRDLEAIYSNQIIPETTRLALIQARIGQGLFRLELMKRYNSSCAVTGIALPALLRASHIKPWAGSTNEERLDPENGLLLTPTLDVLFDRGFITFKKDGTVKICRQLDSSAKNQLGPIINLACKPTLAQAIYLKYHAAHVYRGDA